MNSFMCRRDFVTRGLVAASGLLSAAAPFAAKGIVNTADQTGRPIAPKATSNPDGPLTLPSGHEYVIALDPMAREKPLLGKKIAVLVETEYIYDEIEDDKRRFPALGGEVTLLFTFGGDRRLTL